MFTRFGKKQKKTMAITLGINAINTGITVKVSGKLKTTSIAGLSRKDYI